MPHLYINHHFFYGAQGWGTTLRGPAPEVVEKQLQSVCTIARPARDVWENLEGGDPVFSITVDDGSRSVLGVLDLFRRYQVPVCLCVCAVSTMQQQVLLIHQINLLRGSLGDEGLYTQMRAYFPHFNPETHPLRGNVKLADLYRYDQPLTRRLKTALNYQLTYEQTAQFITSLFERYVGSQADLCRELYLSLDDLLSLQQDGIALAYHGREHRLWSELTAEEHQSEVQPPASLRGCFTAAYVLSIPYGMANSYHPERLLADRDQAIAAWTMGRTLKHQQTADFGWLHRFDQADLFDEKGALKLNPFQQ